MRGTPDPGQDRAFPRVRVLPVARGSQQRRAGVVGLHGPHPRHRRAQRRGRRLALVASSGPPGPGGSGRLASTRPAPARFALRGILGATDRWLGSSHTHIEDPRRTPHA